MDRLFGKLWTYVDHGQLVPHEVRLFRLCCLTAAFISLALVLPTNLLQDLSPYLNLLIFCYGLASLFLYFCSCRGRQYLKSYFALTVAVLSTAWFLNAGSTGSIGYFIMSAALYPLVFFRGRTRLVLLFLLVLDACLLLALDYRFPGLALPYPTPLDRLVDLSTGIAFSVLMLAVVYWVVATTLERELEARKRAEESLCQERDRTLRYLDTVQTIMVVLDADGIICTVNRTACELLGYPEKELLGRNWFDTCLVQPGGREVEHPRYLKMLAAGSDPASREFEKTVVTRAGEEREVLWHYALLRDEGGRVTGTLSSGEDITERKQAEKALRESEERFRSFVESANDIVFSVSSEGVITYVSPNWQETFGLQVRETLGSPLTGFVHPDDAVALREALDGVLKTGHKQSDIEFRFRHAGGSWIWYSVNGSLLHGCDREEVTFLGIGRDINAHKRAEAALRESEQALRVKTAQLEAQSNATPDAILVINQKNRRVFVNRRFNELLGVPAEVLDDDEDTALFQHVLGMTRNPEEFQERVRFLNEHPDYSSRDEIEFKNGMVLERYSAPVLSPDGTNHGRIWSFRDITNQKKFEIERVKIEKLESLGVLAGGIAHDFNNILAGIMGGVSLAQEFIDEEHFAYKPLKTAEKAALRAAELARQLITFAKGGELVKKVLAVRPMVEESVSLTLRGSNVRGVVRMPENLWAVRADEGQVIQAFNNLIINAKQAMPDGGTVTLTGLNVMLPELNVYGLPAGSYVMICCSDEGYGIPEAHLSKIFDPYFTTKSGGTGLGLASVYSILNKHGGNISVNSELGKGTTFTVYLPAAELPGEPPVDPVQQAVGVHHGGSILVMDDEQLVRDLTTEMLTYLGYGVTTCEDGGQAVTLFQAAREAGAPFRAVVMDLTIPGGMGGKEAAQQILSLDPGACLIVSSGYSDDPVMADFASHGFRGAVAKPYRIAELGQLLSALLKEKGEG